MTQNHQSKSIDYIKDETALIEKLAMELDETKESNYDDAYPIIDYAVGRIRELGLFRTSELDEELQEGLRNFKARHKQEIMDMRRNYGYEIAHLNRQIEYQRKVISDLMPIETKTILTKDEIGKFDLSLVPKSKPDVGAPDEALINKITDEAYEDDNCYNLVLMAEDIKDRRSAKHAIRAVVKFTLETIKSHLKQ